jgi:RimJ/RimL family protein N-acetyltransferase
MFAFATDKFPRLALGLTRFAKKTVIPTLFRDLGAHRLQCESHEKHTSAHRWLELLGAEQESVLRGYGKDGSNYFQYVIYKGT